MDERGHGPLPDEALDALVLVLDEIRLGRSRSRSELVERTELGRAIVAQRVGELIERGLVVEGDPGPSTGGRPPRQLTFRARAGHLLVADLGATSIDVALTSLDGRILAHRDEPAEIEAGPDAGLARVEELFDQLVATTHTVPGRLWGIGIAVPGPVEFATGRPISPPIMPGWDGYPIRERFAARYGAPPIRIEAQQRDRHLRVAVEDGGPGMPEELEGRIFDRFARGRGQTGTGLGLAIARGFAEANGGRLWAESRPGQGACFAIALPPR